MLPPRHIMIAQPGLTSLDGILSMVGMREMFRVSRVADGAHAKTLIDQDRPDAAFLDVALVTVSAPDIARYATTHSIPIAFLARADVDLSRLKAIGCPHLREPIEEREFIAMAHRLIAESQVNLARIGVALARLRLARSELSAAVAQSHVIRDEVLRDREERARKARPHLGDWDLVRAAQSMIEQHGSKAAGAAEIRSKNAFDLNAGRRWQNIADTIRELQKRA